MEAEGKVPKDADDEAATHTRVLTAVRIRPVSASEATRGSKVICTTSPSGDEEGGGVTVCDPLFFSSERQVERKFFERKFAFDLAFDGGEQELIFAKLAAPLIPHALTGLNCSLLAYGQTGSGKTHTMIGDSTREGAGVIPRLCRGLLAEISRQLAESDAAIGRSGQYRGCQTQLLAAKVSCSFYEIHNEKVYDLLLSPEVHNNSSSERGYSRVREHQQDGAYIENLTTIKIQSYEEAAALMELGLRQRVVAETKMNAASSRSHAVFTIVVKQTISQATSSALLERSSKIVLVDLAGSERASLTGATGERLIEANNINKSLSALGDVIKALSEGVGSGGSTRREGSTANPGLFVPFRNSILTWLLKDSLGGNSKTTMLATISPAEGSFNETVSTLRYIERAKYIVTSAHVNESSADPAFVVQLQKQIAILQEKLMVANKSRQQRDLELREEFSRREEATAREHDQKVAELQTQLAYYQARTSAPSTPIGTDTVFSSPMPSPVRAGDQPEEAASVDPTACELFPTSSTHPDVLVLQIETARLHAALAQKDNLLATYERKTLTAALESSSSSSSSSSSASSEDRLKRLCLAYRDEKALCQSQYHGLLLKLKSTAETLESERSHFSKVEEVLLQLEEELLDRRAQSRRLEAEALARSEELQTKAHEVEFLKAKQASSSARHRQELILQQMHVSKAKESEEVSRREKLQDLDRFTELLVDSQRRNENDLKTWEIEKAALCERVASLEAAAVAAARDREQIKDALRLKLDDVGALETELASARSVARAAEAESEVHRAEVHRAALALATSEAALENARGAIAAQEVEIAQLRRDIEASQHRHNALALKVRQVEEDAQSKDVARRKLEAGEEFLKSALELEAQELKRALESVVSTRVQLEEKDCSNQELAGQLHDLKAALLQETNARHDAERRATDLAAELTKRKKKLAAAIVALDEKQARISTLSSLEDKLRIAETQMAESEVRHAKQEAKLSELVQSSKTDKGSIADLLNKVRSLEASITKAREAAAEHEAAQTELQGVNLEHSVLLDEVIHLREKIEAERARSKKNVLEILSGHETAMENLEASRAEQYLGLKQALAAADERSRMAEQRIEELGSFHEEQMKRVRGENEQRRLAATNDVQQRLDSILLGTDAFDAQYTAVQRVLSMIEINMQQLDSEMKADVTSQHGSAHSVDAAAMERMSPLSRLASDFDNDKAAIQSPRVVESLETIFSRQQKLYSSVVGFKRNLGGINCVSLPVHQLPSPKDHPGHEGVVETSSTHTAEHDLSSLSQEIIRSKLALAIAASENEDLVLGQKRLERALCASKLEVATLKGELDDGRVVVAQMMAEISRLKTTVKR